MTYTPPKPKKTDHIHTGVRALISSVPLVGGAAIEVFNALIVPPLEKRRNDWMNRIGEAISRLEESASTNWKTLNENEIFIDTLIQASQAALKTSVELKLEALKNATLNASLISIDSSLQHVFISLIDDLSEWHLKILLFLSEHVNGLMLTNQGEQDAIDFFDYTVKRNFPTLAEKKYFYMQIVRDLSSRGLIPEQPQKKAHLHVYGGITEFGIQFVNFIKSPLPQM